MLNFRHSTTTAKREEHNSTTSSGGGGDGGNPKEDSKSKKDGVESSAVSSSSPSLLTAEYDALNVSVGENVLKVIKHEYWHKMPLQILILGACGDFALGQMFPALLELFAQGLLPERTFLSAYDMENKNEYEFRHHILKPALLQHQQEENKNNNNSSNSNAKNVQEFLELCTYSVGKNYGDWRALQPLLKPSSAGNLLVVLTVPAHWCSATTQAARMALKRLEWPVRGFVRLLLENHSTTTSSTTAASCRSFLEALQRQSWTEDTVYRLEPYWGYEMMQSIVTLRKTNFWLKRIFHRDCVSAVHILCRTDALTFSDSSTSTTKKSGPDDNDDSSLGIIRGVLQTHLLQIVTLIAMDPFGTSRSKIYAQGDTTDDENEVAAAATPDAPDDATKEATAKSNSNNDDSFRDARFKVLKHISAISPDDCLLGTCIPNSSTKDSRRRFSKSATASPTATTRKAEDGSTATATTVPGSEPTYICARLFVRSQNWKNVPFLLEAGSGMKDCRCEIRLHLKSENTNDNGGGRNSAVPPNILVLRIHPEPAIFFTTNLKTPGLLDTPVMSTTLGLQYHSDHVPNDNAAAYARLVLECLRGKQSNFLRNDELLAAWRICAPLLSQQQDQTPATTTTTTTTATTAAGESSDDAAASPSAAPKPTEPYLEGSDGPSSRVQFLKSMGLDCVELPRPTAF